MSNPMLALENLPGRKRDAIANAAVAAANTSGAAVVAAAANAAAAGNNAVAAANEVAVLSIENVKRAANNTMMAAPSSPAAKKDLEAAIRCITKKDGKGFYQLPRAYPCPPANTNTYKKGQLTAELLGFFKPRLTKSMKPFQAAVNKKVRNTLRAQGYSGGRRNRRTTRRNRY